MKAERHGIPQARHRLILLGVREDAPALGDVPVVLPARAAVTLREVLDDLLRLRSGLSNDPWSKEAWREAVTGIGDSSWLRALARTEGRAALAERIARRTREVRVPRCGLDGMGGEFVRCEVGPGYAIRWYHDPRLEGVCNHAGRSHIEADLHRSLYAACHAEEYGRSPKLADFPVDLLPLHRSTRTSASKGGGGGGGVGAGSTAVSGCKWRAARRRR